MAFTGYVFHSAAAILPYLEDPHSGPTASFCSAIARALHCHVAAGLPVRLDQSESRAIRAGNSAFSNYQRDPYGRGNDIDQVGANAAVLCDPSGAVRVTYRKTNLFRSDVPWAKPGPGFLTLDLPAPLGTTALGICMDLNPRIGTLNGAETSDLAEHCLRTRARVLIMLNAWLSSEDEDGQEDVESTEDWDTIQYWAYRLGPLYSGPKPDGPGEPDETFVIMCNRTGTEEGVTFAGSSALFRCQRGFGRAQLIDAMGRHEEGVRIWSV